MRRLQSLPPASIKRKRKEDTRKKTKTGTRERLLGKGKRAVALKRERVSGGEEEGAAEGRSRVVESD